MAFPEAARPVEPFLFELVRQDEMRVPAYVFANPELLEQIERDRSLVQLGNVATLLGVTHAVYAMPDAHEGYGFLVGGVAAMRMPDGVISVVKG